MKINTVIYLILAEQTQLDCSGAPPPLYFRCIFSGGAAVEWVSVFDKMAA
jgi:hypothetical protein